MKRIPEVETYLNELYYLYCEIRDEKPDQLEVYEHRAKMYRVERSSDGFYTEINQAYVEDYINSGCKCRGSSGILNIVKEFKNFVQPTGD